MKFATSGELSFLHECDVDIKPKTTRDVIMAGATDKLNPRYSHAQCFSEIENESYRTLHLRNYDRKNLS